MGVFDESNLWGYCMIRIDGVKYWNIDFNIYFKIIFFDQKVNIPFPTQV